MEDVFFSAVFLGVPVYVVLQWYMLRKWEGGWRIAAFVPLIVMAPLLIYTALAFLAQSNLWPLLLILAAPPAYIYLLVLACLRFLFRRRPA
jgi:hypothetical protein